MTSVAGQAVRIGVGVHVLRGVMIDCGFHRARRIVAEAIRTLGVRGVIVTHWHEDHAGNVDMLQRSGVPVSLRGDTEAKLRQNPSIYLYRRAVWGMPPTLTGDVAPFSNDAFECFHTPGHSTDHQVVFDRETGTLFSGDLWLGIRARILHASEDPRQIVQSLRIAAALNPARMFDAHRGPVSNPARALTAKAEWMTNTIGEIERRIAEGWSDREIVKRVLGVEELAALISHGEYSRANFVKAVRAGSRVTGDGSRETA
jgi:glyoxylase-like metal-dependent hydrolase (beta-lactamase superfamily II)